MDLYMNQSAVIIKAGALNKINSIELNNIIRFSLLLFSLQLPSLAPILKYIQLDMHWFLLCYIACISVFYYIIFSGSRQFSSVYKLLNSPLTMIFLFILLLLINAVLYRYQLTLQSIGKGTDAGDALTFTGYNLLHGNVPYSRLTYLNNLVSAGPGLFIITLPFTYIGAYGLLIPLLLILSAWVIKTITQSFLNANIYMLCLLSSPSFMQAVAQGNDYLIIGSMYSLLTVALFYYWGKNWLYNLCFIVSIGLLATARLNFFYLAALLGVFIWKRNKTSGICFALGGLLVTLSIHFGFYTWNPLRYMPLHVIHDYATYTTDSIYRTGLLISFCTIIGITTVLLVKNTLGSWLFFLWLCLLTPLLIGGFFCLIHEHWDAQGIGLGYITLTAPILIMQISLNLKNHLLLQKLNQ